MLRINSIIVFLSLLIALWGCTSKSNQAQPTDEEATQEQKAVAEEINEEFQVRSDIASVILAYYNDLEAESKNIGSYFAPNVEKYYSQTNISGDKVGQIIINTYEGVSERRVTIDKNTLIVNEENEKYSAEFDGNVSLTRTEGNVKVNEDFRNRIVFNQDLKIIQYESLEVRQQTANRKLNANARISTAIQSLLSTLNSEGLTALDNIIHPEKGFFFITRPGAIDAVYHLYKSEEIVSQANTPWIKDKLSDISCNIQAIDLPSYDCDNFSSQGCFLAPVGNVDRISGLMGALEQASIRSFSPEEQGDANSMEDFISYELVVTESYLSMLFGIIDGRWYLLVLDAAKFDCSA